jgi:putative transposase
MYEYRKLNKHEQLGLLHARVNHSRPWHSPPHLAGHGCFLLTAACFEHAPIIRTESRRASFATDLLASLTTGTVHAWVVLPNHYHVLWTGNLHDAETRLPRLHNGTSTRWNREDKRAGRQAWYHFADRLIRSRGHYHAAVNYVHANPVKHGWVENAQDWPASSLRDWINTHGRDHLVTMWRKYPVADFGHGWDE